MAENLKTNKYQNCDLIGTTVPTTPDISGETDPKYKLACAVDDSNDNNYGRLYTRYAVTDDHNICPADWHVSSAGEWAVIKDYLTIKGYGYERSGFVHEVKNIMI